MLSSMGKNSKTVLGFAGKAGAGKTYIAQQTIAHLKSQGLRIAIIAYADPIKTLLMKFGLTKSGPGVAFSKIEHETAFARLTDYFVDIRAKNFVAINGRNKSELLIEVADVVYRRIDAFMMHFDQLIKNANNQEQYKFHYRKLITLVGTEIGRDISPTIWIDDLIHSSLDLFAAGIDTIFVDDVRFYNEYVESIKKFKAEGVEMAVWGVAAPSDVRAKRQGISLDAVIEHDKHSSEKEVDLIFADLPSYMIITND